MNSNRPSVPEDPITRDELVDVFMRAQRVDQTTHLIGTELEKAGVYIPPDGGPPRPVNYEDHILPTLKAMCERFGWEPGPDRGIHAEIVELVRQGASITLEPGGQLELSGAPLPNVHATCAEFSQHYDELHEVSLPLSLAWMAVGHHPWARRDEINWMPKGRYRVMRDYLPTQGARALDMMLRTCTVQANFDYASEQQCGERFRLANAIAPLITAIFANSPYLEGANTKLASIRSQVWLDVDPARCGVPRFAFETFSYERYVDWALDIPTFFIKRDGQYHPYHVPFRDFMTRGIVDAQGQRIYATHSDWQLHLSTVFPEIRLKPHIEFRSADAVGSRYVCALPAFIKGLIYDSDAGAQAWDHFASFRYEERLELWNEAIEHGLRSPRLRDLARILVRLSREALDRMDVRDDKNRTESRFIDRLDPLVESGTTPGFDVLEQLGDHPGRDPQSRRAFVRAFHFAGVGGPESS